MRKSAPVALFIFGVFAVALLYGLALPGYWLFDDWPNLVGLNQVDDLRSALSFVFSGNSGPLGRPVSLATFALQADAWDGRPEVMIAINIAVHLCAMLAVFFLASGLALLRLPPALRARAWWVGAFTASIWGLAPFLAPTHLMPIQRMASLSGLFVFGGLALFVWAHLVRRQTVSRLLLIVGLGLGTLLATLSKENGALLPLLALLVALAWIPREERLGGGVDRAILGLLVLAPSLLLLGYIGTGLVQALLEGDYGARRDFSVVERLVTQPVILWDYVRNLLLPRAISASPFMDHVPASEGLLESPKALLASIAWVVVVVAAVLLRNRAPWFAFGVGFFLVAHVLESTYIGLELYFAHRNYVPAFGVFFGLVFFAFAVRPRGDRAPFLVLGAYSMVVAFVLFQVTSNWNDKLVNGKLWLEHNPHSVRAHQFLAKAYIDHRDLVSARRVLDQAASRYPEHDLLQLQRTAICVGRESEFPELLESVSERFRKSDRYHSNLATELRRAARDNPPTPLCRPRTHEVLIQLADQLLENPTYRNREFAHAQLLLVKAFSSSALGQDKRAVEYFHDSLRLRPDLDIAFRALSLQANLGDYDGALEFLAKLEEMGPRRALERPVWDARIHDFRDILRESREIDEQRH